MHKPSVKLHFIFFNYFKGNYFIAVPFLLYILMDYVSFCQFNWQIFCSIKESSSIHWKFPICTRREFSSTWPQRLFLKQPFFFFTIFFIVALWEKQYALVMPWKHSWSVCPHTCFPSSKGQVLNNWILPYGSCTLDLCEIWDSKYIL